MLQSSDLVLVTRSTAESSGLVSLCGEAAARSYSPIVCCCPVCGRGHSRTLHHNLLLPIAADSDDRKLPSPPTMARQGSRRPLVRQNDSEVNSSKSEVVCVGVAFSDGDT